jgi:uncharacterized protein YecT (DUF1311 family)
MLSAALIVFSLLATVADAGPRCADDEVAWKGRCFSRYDWEPDDPSCLEGVIVIPEGEDAPKCVPCESYQGMQQPMNYCTGMRAMKAEATMKARFDELVKGLPARERELRNAQRDWMKKRDATCRRAGEQYEGGSLQPQVENECLLARTRKRIDELARVARAATIAATPAASATAASARGPCGGDPAGQTGLHRRAAVVVEKSRFQDEPKACPADGRCPWRRQAYVVRGDEVTEWSLSHDFACVTFNATSGWLPLHDLCEAGAACASQ